MKCPKCQADNPETARFCLDCGSQLIRGYVPDSPESGTCPQNSNKVRPEVTETLQTPIKELTTGSTFAGRYQIIEELGKGRIRIFFSGRSAGRVRNRLESPS